MKKLLSVLFLLLSAHVCIYAQLITYKSPEGVILNTDFTVLVRMGSSKWLPLATYQAKVVQQINGKSVPQNTAFCYFDCSGDAEISVTYHKGPIKEVQIRPLSFNIKPKISGNKITFPIKSNQNVSLEVNGDIFHNLQVFSNAIETSKPLISDTNVIYYGPGLHQVGKVKVTSGKTVYIAGGAVVQGSFSLSHVENVRILGHGILTQLGDFVNKKPQTESSPKAGSVRNDMLTVEYSKNVEINGPIVLPHKYSVLVGQSSGVTIRNLKSFSSEGWGDGIDIFCSTDVLVDHVYMRNSDDCIAIYGHRWEYYGDVGNITVQNSTLWADVAHPVLIGTHGDSDHPNVLEKIKFLNIDILNQHENQIDYQGCLSLNAGDSNTIRDVLFDNIRIEDIHQGQLINLRVVFNHKYNTSAGKGIENIYFKDVSYHGSKPNLSIIAGYDEPRGIRNIVFENLSINDQLISDTMPGKPAWYKTGDMANFYIGSHVNNITFVSSKK